MDVDPILAFAVAFSLLSFQGQLLAKSKYACRPRNEDRVTKCTVLSVFKPESRETKVNTVDLLLLNAYNLMETVDKNICYQCDDSRVHVP